MRCNRVDGWAVGAAQGRANAPRSGLRRGRSVAPLVLAALVLAGCSSSPADPLSGLRSGAGGPRPADACTLLTSDQVATIVGTPGPYTGAHEDPADDGTPVWGCTWGTQRSYADLRELTAAQFAQVQVPDDTTVITPLSGIGDKALLQRNRDDGSNSYVYFATHGRYYEVQVCVDRHADADEGNGDHEAAAAQELARLLLPRLSG